jgi:hypothetical protein
MRPIAVMIYHGDDVVIHTALTIAHPQVAPDIVAVPVQTIQVYYRAVRQLADGTIQSRRVALRHVTVEDLVG